MTLFSHLARLLIMLYRCAISPFVPMACRFAPTCSEYALEAFRIHSFPRAVKLVITRITSCHPWGKSGFDPVPPHSHRH